MEVTSGGDGTAFQRVVITWSSAGDDPHGVLAALVASGRLEQALLQVGTGAAPARAADAVQALEAVRDLLGALEPRRRSLLLAGRALGLSWGDLARASGIARQTVKRWVLRESGDRSPRWRAGR